MQSFLGLGQAAEVGIELLSAEKRKKVEVLTEEGKKERLPLYYDGESVSGKVSHRAGQAVLTVDFQVRIGLKGRKMEHQGIRVEFIGQIELFYDRGNNHDFLSLVKQLDPPREMAQDAVYDFEFHQVEKPHETYTGTNVRLRYIYWRG